MDTTTLELILLFLFAVIALLALGARSFTRLVELILSNGSKTEALRQEVLRAQTSSSDATASLTELHRKVDTLTTQAGPNSSSIESTVTKKSAKSL